MPEAGDRCPDDGAALAGAPDGLSTCPRCGGALCSAGELDGVISGANELLAVETRPDSGAYAKVRACPACAKPMVPLRIAKMDAWVERCPSCESLWVERQDRRTLVLSAKQKARSQAYATFTPQERKEMAEDLAREAAPDAPPLSAFHQLLALFGLPVVARTQGSRTPWATWGLVAANVAVFLVGHFGSDPEAFVAQFGYRSDAPSLAAAFTSTFVHGGWMHLLGNVYFLLAFGDGVEQRMPRPVMVGGFLGTGALACAVQGWTADGPQLIYGASGAIAAVMGACVVLQPRAKVMTAFLRAILIPIPIWLYALFELAYQSAMAALGVPGVAWMAHLAGLLLGLAGGAAVALRGRRAPAPAH